MQCPICRGPENWKLVDQYRYKPEGMALCQTCGFISYPAKYKSKAEIIEYYRKAYREAPTVGALYTGERKLQYHAFFLEELFKEWRNTQRKDILVCDIGSALGMFLNWVRSQVPADVYGVELTTSYVRNAWHLFKIKSEVDFDDTRKYDLISSYKSLEHILDPDVELRRYISALKDDGVLYLSVPIWFESLKNFGHPSFDLEYYYSPNHINTWTRKHVEGLIKVCGGEVVKENRSFYDTAWLIKRSTAAPADRTVAYDDPNRITSCLEKVFAASDAFQMGAFTKVLEIWPNCPPAWTGHYEMNRKAFHDQGFDFIYKEVCEKALAECNEDADMHYLAGDICARYDKYEKAIEHLARSNELRPNQPQVFMLLSNCFRSLGKVAPDEKARVDFYEKSRKSARILGDISTQAKGEAMTWVMLDNSNLPTPFEGKECHS